MTEFCCANCFDHPWLVEFVESQCSVKGECSFCGAMDVPLRDVSTLTPYFKNLISAFRPLEYGSTLLPDEDPVSVGEPLVFLIQGRWRVFDEAVYDSDSAGRLLEAILNSDWDDDSGDGPIRAEDLYTCRAAHWASSPAQDWEDFVERIKEKPNLEPAFRAMLEEDIWQLELELPVGSTVHRARHGWDPKSPPERKEAYQGREIGAPSSSAARAGRANKEGESVIYVSEKEETAIAEIRPLRGAAVSVGKLRIVRILRLLDLGNPIPEPNPFTREPLQYWLEQAELLEAFALTLAKPLERTDDYSDYLASQKLCAYLREIGFDGIRYPSAMDPNGINIVIFDTEGASPITSRLVTITHASVSYKDYSDDIGFTLRHIK